MTNAVRILRKRRVSIMLALLLGVTNVMTITATQSEKQAGGVTESVQQDTQKRVTGRVTDQTGEPLPGVNVSEVGGTTPNGTITDVDGMYELKLNQKNAKLTFSFIGFEDMSVNIGGPTVYDVSLKESVSELNEVVVVGYGQQRKISSVSSQATMKAADIKAPTASLSTVLAGRLAGVVAVQRSGEPGKDGADIWIRGMTTTNNAKPLVLVDGVERSFNDLDPEDIESVTILKDASATAVYGVRGANGVIIVKTKPGIIGKPTVSVDYYEGFNRFTKAPEMADGITYMNAANEAAANIGRTTPVYSEDYIKNTRLGTDKLLYPNVDWRKEVFNDWAHSRRVNANIRGGSPMAQFYASISYYNETGMLETNDFENYDSQTKYTRYNFTTNVNLKVTETTTVDIGAQGYLGDGNYSGEGSGTIFSSTMEVNPVLYPKMFVLDGKEYIPGIHAQGSERNPYADATKRGYRKQMNNKVQSNIRLTQDLDIVTKGLKLTAMFAYDVSNNRELKYQKRENTYYFADRNNPYDESGRPILTTTWDKGSEILGFDGNSRLGGERKDNFEISLVYDRAFGDHRVGAMGIYTQQGRTVNDAGDIVGSIPYRLQGMAGRATYSWKDRYFGEFTIGYNGGENFPKDKRFGTFPAVGAGWVLSNESFWEPLNTIIPFMKIRYTNGKVGNSSVNDRRFMYLEQYEWKGDHGYEFGSNIGIDGVRVKNPATSLGWEIAHKQELGLDLQMFNSDLNITANLFKENRSNILLKRDNSLPGFAGFQEVPFGNVGKSKQKGFDGSLEYRKKLNKDWSIEVRGNFTYTDAVWVDDDKPEYPYAWRNRTGFSLVSVEGFTAKRLYTQNDINVINAWYALPEADRKETTQPFPTPYKVSLNQVKAGDILYEDKNKDGKIDDTDISWLGDGDVPKINYGFGFNVDYKAFSLGLLFQGTAKASRFVDSFVYAFNNSGSSNVFSNIDDRWTEDNPSQDVFYPRLAYGNDAAGNLNNTMKSTWWLKDMSFLRLKTVQFAYKLPETWTRKMHIRNASVYMMGMNLFTLSKWKLWDPELNTGNGTSYPNTTSYTIGINFSF